MLELQLADITLEGFKLTSSEFEAEILEESLRKKCCYFNLLTVYSPKAQGYVGEVCT